MLRELAFQALNRLFHARGMELRALTPLNLDASMTAGLRRAAALCPEIGTVVDVGAAAGKWTRLALPHFPRARFLLLEPLAERGPELTALHGEHARVEHVSAAAGRAPGEAQFHIAEDLDGSGLRATASAGTRGVPVTTLDHELSARSLPAPYFIKLDTHGYEVPILEGAEQALRQASLLMIEAYNFRIADECLRFHELCAWLEARGFRPIDLLEPLRRPHDQILWQIDLVFARTDHPVFARGHY
jgi:FkbM family methyltransferase